MGAGANLGVSPRRIQIVVDAVPDAGGGGLDGVPREMGIAGVRLNLGMAQQVPDHRQSLAERQRAGSEAVPEVMDPHIVEVRLLSDTPPRVLKVGEMAARLAAGDHQRIVLVTGRGL